MIRPLASILFFCLTFSLAHAKDLGKETIGKIRATLYLATNTDPQTLGKNAKNWQRVDPTTTQRFQHIPTMRFEHYRKLGEDTQPVFRSYENWLTPLKPSETILLSFESRGFNQQKALILDLELWQNHRKIMKSAPRIKKGIPLLILGPKWRKGTLIIAVELIEISPNQ